MTNTGPSEPSPRPSADDPLEDQAAEQARLYDEQARIAGADMPGTRAPLPPGRLHKLPPEPQGDENRQPPPGAPARPPDALGSQPTVMTTSGGQAAVKPEHPRQTDPAAPGD